MRLAMILSLTLLSALSLDTDLHAAGEFWVVDQDQDQLHRLTIGGDIVLSTDLTGTGFGLAVASDGSVWVATSAPATLVHVDVAGTIVDTVTLSTPAQSIAIAADGTLWIVRSSEGVVEHRDAAGALLASIPVGAVPYGVAIDGAGRVWITNSYGNSVSRIDLDGTSTEISVGFYPTGIAVHPDGKVWVIEKEGVTVLDSDGALFATLPSGGYPRAACVTLSGEVWVTEQNAHLVRRFAADGTALGEIPVGTLPWGIAAGGDGSAIVLCRIAGEVWRVAPDGEVLGTTAMPYPHAFGDLSGLALALVANPTGDDDGDEAPNGLEAIGLHDPLDALSHPSEFTRGDVTRDGILDLADPVALLEAVLGSGLLDCPAAADVDDNDQLGIADAVILLSYLFAAGAPPASPFPAPGHDSSWGALSLCP